MHSSAERALEACRALVAAYNRGEDRGGSVDWADVDRAHALAVEALGGPPAGEGVPPPQPAKEDADLLPNPEPFLDEYGVDLFVGVGASDLRICPHTEEREGYPFIYRSGLAGANRPTTAPPGPETLVIRVCGRCATRMQDFSRAKAFT